MSVPHRLSGAAAAVAGLLLVAACTAGAPTNSSSSGAPPTVSSPVVSSTVGSSPQNEPATEASGGPSVLQSTGVSRPPASTGSSLLTGPTPNSAPGTTATTSTKASTPVIVPVIGITPRAQATDVNPVDAVTVTAADGTLTSVSMTNPEGRTVKGSMSTDHRTWRTTEVLGYGREYRVLATATSETGTEKRSDTRFTTLQPTSTVYPSFFPSPDLKSVGVGQPMVVIFDQAPTDRKAAEQALKVTTTPKTEGAWYWWDDRTLHWRPKNFWKSGTKVKVEANIYGVDLGSGSYGETDRKLEVTIGKSKIAIVDDATKHMKIYVDGKLVDDVPVSLGMNKVVKGSDGQDISFLTPSGIYVAKEKYTVKRMTSSSYGLPTSSSLGYDSQIPLAVRFSDSGIFVHSAPWSVDDQGVRNVSHGCINMPPSAAKWFFDNFSYGDVLEVKNTSTELPSWDGYGDWNVSWSDWQKGSELA